MSQSDRERASGEQIVHDLGMAPALDIDSDQRAELLRSWHEEDDEKAPEEKEAP